LVDEEFGEGESRGEAFYARATQISNAEILCSCIGFQFDNKIM